jgi:hypothetical protein
MKEINNIGLWECLNSIHPNADFSIYCGEIIWREKDIKCPTKKELETEQTKLIANYNSKKYQRDRKYPDLGEQFDLLFKDIDSGKVNKDGGFYKTIKSVKDAHPKPE